MLFFKFPFRLGQTQVKRLKQGGRDSTVFKENIFRPAAATADAR